MHIYEIEREDDDKYYTIESFLKHDGYFVFSQDELKHQGDETIVKRPEYTPFVPKKIVKEEIETVKAEVGTAKEEVGTVSKGPEAILAQIQKIIPEKYERPRIHVEDDSHYDIPSIISLLQWHMNRISQKVIGREEIIEQIIYAILTGEHLLLLSRTGMAKSYLANHVFSIFENVRIFSAQASKDQTPDNYFGPYDIEEFKRGVIRHNIKKSIIEANMVLLDEFFDASDVVLRSLLSVLNERKFVNGPEQIDVAIHTAIATANYMRLNEVTEAVLDRFIYKAIIPEDNDMYNSLLIDNAYALSKGKVDEPARKIPFDQLLYVHNIIKNNNKKIQIALPDTIKFMKNVIINKFVSEIRKSEANFFISPRKQAKMSDFLRASAILNNRMEVNTDDLRNMYIGLVTLNRFISIKQKDKLFKDVFIDTLEQTMSHFKATNAYQQIDFLLNIKKIFQTIRDDPAKKEKLHEDKGLLQSVRDILLKLFPFKSKDKDENLTVESLKKNIIDLNPYVEEVRDLKQGILRDYRDIN